MSRLTVELLRDPELQPIAHEAYEDEMFAARSEGRFFDRNKMLARMDALLDWRIRALRAERKLQSAGARPTGGDR